jgi:hypothetical protein
MSCTLLHTHLAKVDSVFLKTISTCASFFFLSALREQFWEFRLTNRITRSTHIRGLTIPYNWKVLFGIFYILLTVHLDAILGNDQLDALFLNVFIFMPLRVSSSKCSSSGGPNGVNTSSGITHSGNKIVKNYILCFKSWLKVLKFLKCLYCVLYDCVVYKRIVDLLVL